MRKPLLLAIFLFVCVASPARAQFCPGVSPWVFDDVAASDPFCSYITWMAENGITLGCVTIDANHRLYCPNAAVTRAASGDLGAADDFATRLNGAGLVKDALFPISF